MEDSPSYACIDCAGELAPDGDKGADADAPVADEGDEDDDDDDGDASRLDAWELAGAELLAGRGYEDDFETLRW